MVPSRIIQGTQGTYEVLGMIASGAMGRVFLARHRSPSGELLGEVAIKRIGPELRDDPNIRQMFSDEGRLSLRLVHPNIVRVIEVGEIEDGPYLAMELVSGVTMQSLAQRLLERQEVLPVPLVLDVVMQTLDGLDYAHRLADENGERLNVVHRDVSPQNLMVGFSGAVKLFDFGVGKAKGQAHRTNPGFVKGRLAYMSPEQIRNEAVDARSDLFSVGVLAYEALVVVHPFFGKTDSMLMRAVMEQPPPDPTSIDPNFPPGLSDILLRALAKDPEERFQDAGAFREALRRFVSGWVFPPGPGLAELVQDAFRARVETERRARRRGDDELLVRAMRDELYEEDLRSSSLPRPTPRRGEELFADLPTAEIETMAQPVDLDTAAARPRATSVTPPPREVLPDLDHGAALWTVLESMPVPAYASREDDGVLLYANPPMRELFGLDPAVDEVRAEALYVNAFDRERMLSRMGTAEVERGFIVELRRRDGRTFWGSLSARRVQWQGTPILLGSVADVSDRVEVESRLARRLAHQRRMAAAIAALLRVREGDPADAGLREALEHLRAGTDVDRVVLIQNEEHPEQGLLMRRSHVSGVGPDGDARIPYARVPRWRALFERGEVLRGRARALPEAERTLLERFGVVAILAVPIRRSGRCLGALALEVIREHPDWTDEDVTSVETLAGVLAGELARRRDRALGGVLLQGQAAALVSAGARLRAGLPRLRELARTLPPDHPACAELRAELEALSVAVSPERGEPRAWDLGAALSALPDTARVEVAPDCPEVEVEPSVLRRLVHGVVAELAGSTPIGVRVDRGPIGQVELRLALPPSASEVWAALTGDSEALARVGSRVGALHEIVQELSASLRLYEDEGGLHIVLELPAARALASSG